jgi:hypothetical protein
VGDGGHGWTDLALALSERNDAAKSGEAIRRTLCSRQHSPAGEKAAGRCGLFLDPVEV